MKTRSMTHRRCKILTPPLHTWLLPMGKILVQLRLKTNNDIKQIGHTQRNPNRPSNTSMHAEWRNLKTHSENSLSMKIYGKRAKITQIKVEEPTWHVWTSRADGQIFGRQTKEQSNKLNKGRRRCQRRVGRSVSPSPSRSQVQRQSYRHISFPFPTTSCIAFCAGCTSGEKEIDRAPVSESRTQLCTCSTQPPDGETITKAPRPPHQTTRKSAAKKQVWLE